MFQYHFHFYGGGPSGPPSEGIVVSTTPAARYARLVRSLSGPAIAPPGRLSRDRSPRRERSPRHERSPRREHRSRSRRRHRRHHIREDLSPLTPKQLEHRIGPRASSPDHQLRGLHQRLPVFCMSRHRDLAQL